MEKVFWIPGNTPSSKNSRVFVMEQKRSFPSASAQNWWRKSKKSFIEQYDEFIKETQNLTLPLYVEFTFVRQTKRTFDYNNAIHIVTDAMKAYKWITDDNVDCIKPYYGDYEYDKNNPGTRIVVLKEKPLHKLPIRLIKEKIVETRDLMRNGDKEWETSLKQVYNYINQK